MICSTYIIYQFKKLKIEVDKVGQNFFWSRKIFCSEFVFWKKSLFFDFFWPKIPKNLKFKIKCTTTMYTECSVQISDFFNYCFLFLCMFFKLHLIAKYFIKIVLTARFVDIFPTLKMNILLNPFDFLLFRHPIMQLKAKK